MDVVKVAERAASNADDAACIASRNGLQSIATSFTKCGELFREYADLERQS